MLHCLNVPLQLVEIKTGALILNWKQICIPCAQKWKTFLSHSETVSWTTNLKWNEWLNYDTEITFRKIINCKTRFFLKHIVNYLLKNESKIGNTHGQNNNFSKKKECEI